MNKGKRIGLIIGTAILSIILVVVFSTVAVRSTTVKKSVELGNKYIAEGNYKEAIIAFEKAINIDTKNKDVKETLDILYIYEEIDELVTAGDLTAAQTKLEEIKDMPKFDIIKEMAESIEQVIEDEIIKDGMGNSVENHLNGGLVAYSGKYVYYSNPNDESTLYKMNIESGENEKIADENAKYINIYNDYVYYIHCSGDPQVYTDVKREVKRVSINGGEIETVLGLDENIHESMQIVDDTLYYDANLFYDQNFGFYSATYDIIAMNLETLEKKTINNLNIHQWVIAKNINEEVNLYGAHRYGVGIIRDITNENSSLEYEILKDRLSNASIIGVNDSNIYYNILHLDQAFSEATRGSSGIGITNHLTNQSKVFYESRDFLTGVYILGDNILFNIDYDNRQRINEIDLTTKRVSNSIYIDICNSDTVSSGFYNYYYPQLFEVKGYLAYFNENNELTIDKDIIVKEMNNKEEEAEEENIEETTLEDEELKEIIRFVKEEVKNICKEEVVFQSYNEDTNIYDFRNVRQYANVLYHYNASNGDIIIDVQAIQLAINDNFRVVADRGNDVTSFRQMLLDDISMVTIGLPSEELRDFAKGVFGEDVLDYGISPTVSVEIDGYKYYQAAVNMGTPNYNFHHVYIREDGKVYKTTDVVATKDTLVETILD